jgi:predicted house-cleaning noncanonical NTP pyrophosphatase (MazG superfamily)
VIAKLVRDRIPDLIRAQGFEPIIRPTPASQIGAYLLAKLHEEVAEFEASADPEELADILEVVYALAEALDVSADCLDTMRERKAVERGRFTHYLIWLGNRGDAA